jgi:hypothetical protein
MSLMMVLYYWDLFIGLHPSPLCFPNRSFKGWFFPHPQVKPTLLGLFDQASLYWSTDRGLLDRPDPTE